MVGVMIDGKEYLTLKEAAAVTGLKYNYIRQLISRKHKRLRVFKLDERTTLILAEDIKAFAAAERNRGRPPQQKS